MYTIENKKYGGKPCVPEHEWFAKTSAVNSLQESYTNLSKFYSKQVSLILFILFTFVTLQMLFVFTLFNVNFANKSHL